MFSLLLSIRRGPEKGGKGASQMMIVAFMLIVMVIMDDDVVRDWAPPKSFCRESYDMWCQPKW